MTPAPFRVPRLNRWALIATIGAAAVAGVSLLAGEVLFQPAHRRIGPPPHDLHATTVEIPTANGHVTGWIAPGTKGEGAVLLLHGVRGDRVVMLERARFLGRLGYGVLLIDLPAHGESSGKHITYGAREAEGVEAALQFLAQQQPGEKLGVIGVSLGAASTVLAKLGPTPDAVVLESMFPTITDAVTDRFIHFAGTAKLAPMFLKQFPWRVNVSPDQLRPIDKIAAIGCPVLIASGSRDPFTVAQETQNIFTAAREPKELWMVEGARHEDLHAFTPNEYEQRITAFFAKYLKTSKAS